MVLNCDPHQEKLNLQLNWIKLFFIKSVVSLKALKSYAIIDQISAKFSKTELITI